MTFPTKLVILFKQIKIVSILQVLDTKVINLVKLCVCLYYPTIKSDYSSNVLFQIIKIQMTKLQNVQVKLHVIFIACLEIAARSTHAIGI